MTGFRVGFRMYATSLVSEHAASLLCMCTPVGASFAWQVLLLLLV
jgi:hypothetical protein